MEIASNILLVTSLLFLVTAVFTALVQVIKDGPKGVKLMPGGLFLGLYAITYAVWLFL